MDWLVQMLLPLTRVSAFLLAAPIFPQVAVNVRIRIIYCMVLCLLMLPAIVPDPKLAAHVAQTAPNLALVIQETLLGVTMGLALQVVTAAVALAGEQISQAIGLGFAQSYDPTVGATPVMSQMLNLLAMLVFISLDGHLMVIRMVAESLRTLPAGETRPIDLAVLVEFSKVIFTGAALISAPLVLTLIAVNLGVGALSRATPSLNVFAVGFAVTLLVGFGMLFLLIPVMAARIGDLWSQASAALAALLGSG